MWKRGNGDGRYCVTCRFFLGNQGFKIQRCLIAQSLNPWIHISFRIMLPPLYCWSYPAILSFQRDWLTGIPRASSHLGMSFSPFLLFCFGLQSKGRHHAEAPWNGPRKQKDQKSGLSGLKGKLSGRKDGSKKQKTSPFQDVSPSLVRTLESPWRAASPDPPANAHRASETTAPVGFFVVWIQKGVQIWRKKNGLSWPGS